MLCQVHVSRLAAYLAACTHLSCLSESSCSSVQFSSVQDGTYALGKTHMHSTLSLRSFPNVPIEAVPMFV